MLGATGIAALIPFLLPFSFPLQLLFAGAALIAVAGLSWRSGLIGIRHAVWKVCWLPDGRWQLFDAKSASYFGDLHVHTRVLGYMIWLHWGSEHGNRHLVLVRGVAPFETTNWRRLIVRLRLEGKSKSAESIQPDLASAKLIASLAEAKSAFGRRL